MSEPSSPTSPTALAFYDPDSSCWRTSQGCLLSEAPELLQRLPAWGTTSGGVLYELQMPARLIDVRDGSALLGTPTTSDTNGAGLHGDGGPDLRTAVTLLPTSRAQNGESRNMKPWIRPLDQPQNLENAIARLLPTPQHWDHKVFGPNVDWKKRAESHAESVASVLMTLPSDNGNESSDGQHPPQQTTEDCDPSSSSG